MISYHEALIPAARHPCLPKGSLLSSKPVSILNPHNVLLSPKSPELKSHALLIPQLPQLPVLPSLSFSGLRYHSETEYNRRIARTNARADRPGCLFCTTNMQRHVRFANS